MLRRPPMHSEPTRRLAGPGYINQFPSPLRPFFFPRHRLLRCFHHGNHHLKTHPLPTIHRYTVTAADIPGLPDLAGVVGRWLATERPSRAAIPSSQGVVFPSYMGVDFGLLAGRNHPPSSNQAASRPSQARMPDVILSNPACFADATLLDAGTVDPRWRQMCFRDTSILSLFATRAGAKRVFATDASAGIVSRTRQIVKANGRSTIPNNVDVMISEWTGYALLYKSLLNSVLVACGRFLAPTGDDMMLALADPADTREAHRLLERRGRVRPEPPHRKTPYGPTRSWTGYRVSPSRRFVRALLR
ncbi:Protein arginine N-methyltransferase [Mycena chlorophos]|uniref:Protein arginine N-methyltransferase n=1 Tax=Mycena chlorophos TaxID=658473 RepID=A0A8H6TAX9_MYCCL|nr:Protein arginine N-methyltransferase [Mycena chlorophos]